MVHGRSAHTASLEEGVNVVVNAVGLVDEVPEGFRLSDKGYDALFQRDSSYCPHR